MRIHRTGILVAGLLSTAVASPAQQLWFARNDTPSYVSSTLSFAESGIAFRFTAPGNDTITAAQVFTGNQGGLPQTVEVRAHDTTTGAPGALVGAAGLWSGLRPRTWQGAVLGQPASVTAGQDYWLVWRFTGQNAQAPWSSNNLPGNVPVEVRTLVGAAWQPPVQLPAKFRLFTGTGSGPIAMFGIGKPGFWGNPQIEVAGWPTPGGVVDVSLDVANRSSLAILLLGLPVPGGVVLPGGTLFTTANVSFWHSTDLNAGVGWGSTNHSFFVPNVPMATGFPLTFQWVVFDPAAAQGIAHTSAITTTVQ